MYIIINTKNNKMVIGWEIDFRSKPYSIYESNIIEPLIFWDKDDALKTAKRLGKKYKVVEL